MRIVVRLVAVSGLLLLSQAAFAAPAPHFARNAASGQSGRVHVASAAAGTGLAPTTWGFAARYSGTLYGTGYYPFQVDQTYSGTNSAYGYTYSYPSFGFVNDIRAIYAFDISAIAGQTPPVWSSFMFDTRERPAAGSEGASAFGAINLVSSGNTHTLQGFAFFLGNGAANLDVYDAEDFENDAPFDNPELAFLGNNPLIGTIPVSTDAVIPISIDVSAAVIADIGAPLPSVVEVPTLGAVGLAALVLLLAATGAVILRRRRA